ncbi:MAG TPA: S24 family peptidase [Gemmata sp.]
MRRPLTDIEQRVYERLKRTNGATLQELATAFGWASTRAAGRHLENIEAKGWVRRTAGRGWQRVEFLEPKPAGSKLAVLAPGAKDFSVPIAGYVAAGQPIPPAVPDGERLELGRILGQVDVQLLQVRGDSMVEAAILHGDYVAVRPCAKSDEGKVVVAEINGCHTLKVYRTLKGAPYLYPKNRTMEPIKLRDRDDPRLVGVFVALVRLVPPKV